MASRPPRGAVRPPWGGGRDTQSRVVLGLARGRVQSVGGKKPHVLLGALPQASGRQGQEEGPGRPWDLPGHLWRLRSRSLPHLPPPLARPSGRFSGEVWASPVSMATLLQGAGVGALWVPQAHPPCSLGPTNASAMRVDLCNVCKPPEPSFPTPGALGNTSTCSQPQRRHIQRLRGGR